MSGNRALRVANVDKNDEFYTQLSDIEKELRHYRKHFKGKTVFCNCDDPFESNFFKFFVLNFNRLGLNKLIATCYSDSPIAGGQLSLFDVLGGDEKIKNKPYKAIVTKVYDKTGDGGVDMFDVAELFMSGENELTELEGDGDFRSEESLALMDEADIVVTNPPFSLFREYVTTLIEHKKSFIIIGNQNAITYKEVFTLMMNDEMWLGSTSPKEFIIPSHVNNRKNTYVKDDGTIIAKFGNICWFTNLDIKKRHEEIILVKRFNDMEYRKYDNFDAVEVSKIVEIPSDYSGVMGVPITFMNKYNPDQFEIIGMAHGDMGQALGVSSNFTEEKCQEYFRKNKAFRRGFVCYTDEMGNIVVPYMRILIKNKKPEESKEM